MTNCDADRDGKLGGIVLGFDNLDCISRGIPTSAPPSDASATASPRASSPSMDRDYRMARNDGATTCMAAFAGTVSRAEAEIVGNRRRQFAYVSPDGEEGTRDDRNGHLHTHRPG